MCLNVFEGGRYFLYPHKKSAKAATWVIIDCRTSIVVTIVMVHRGHIVVVGLGDHDPCVLATKKAIISPKR